MNKNEYWAAHVKKNPGFADESKQIKITVGSLRRLIEDAHEKGYSHGKDIKNTVLEMLKNAQAKGKI